MKRICGILIACLLVTLLSVVAMAEGEMFEMTFPMGTTMDEMFAAGVLGDVTQTEDVTQLICEDAGAEEEAFADCRLSYLFEDDKLTTCVYTISGKGLTLKKIYAKMDHAGDPEVLPETSYAAWIDGTTKENEGMCWVTDADEEVWVFPGNKETYYVMYIDVSGFEGGETLRLSVKENIRIIPGDTVEMEVKGLAENDGGKLKWSSDDKKIATVKDGMVTAKKAGTTVIRVESADGLKGSYAFTVNPETVNMKVFAKATLLENEHVGNDWGVFLYVNDVAYESVKEMVVPLKRNDELKVVSHVQEFDTKSDSAKQKEAYVVTDADLEGFTMTHELEITESNGRYAGNKAKWEIAYTFEPME